MTGRVARVERERERARTLRDHAGPVKVYSFSPWKVGSTGRIRRCPVLEGDQVIEVDHDGLRT